MDAHAHLLSLGWAGPGHSLDSRPQKGRRGLAYDPKLVLNTGNGLVKPLLISQKKNTFGIGKKAHEPAAGNEWWLKGFETALSNIGKSDGERTSGTATPESVRSTNTYTGKHLGLYSFFVKGGKMEGTIGLEAREATLIARKKRKSDNLESHEESLYSSDTEEQATGTRKKHKPKEDTEEFKKIGAFLQARDKVDKRSRRRQKADALEEFQQVGEFFEARSSRRKASLSVRPHHPNSEPVEDFVAKVSEDAEQERQHRRKERKAATVAKALQEASDGKNLPVPTTTDARDDQLVEKNTHDVSTLKSARTAEKKRRKELGRN